MACASRSNQASPQVVQIGVAATGSPITRAATLPTPATPPDKAQDFHCGDCGLTLIRRSEHYRHNCGGIPSHLSQLGYQAERADECGQCEFAADNVCLKYKAQHPDRDCRIDIGIKIPYARCPVGKWDRRMIQCPRCTRVLFDPDQSPTRCRYCGWMQSRDPLPAGTTIVTATDQAFLRGAYMVAWTALRANDARLIVYDLGGIDRIDPMVRQMQSWGVEFRQFEPVITEIRGWQTFNKPFVILDAMKDSEQVFWIDADAAVAKSIRPAVEAIAEGPFVPDHGYYVPNANANSEAIREAIGARRREWGVHRDNEWPCAGILGLDSQRDRGLVEEWIAITLRLRDEGRLEEVAYFDQGILQEILDCDLADGFIWNNLHVLREGSVATIVANVYNQRHAIAHFGGKIKPWDTWQQYLTWGDPRTFDSGVAA